MLSGPSERGTGADPFFALSEENLKSILGKSGVDEESLTIRKWQNA